MAPSPYRATVFVLYQLSIVVGIVFLPIALVANRVGITLPIGEFLDRLDTAYERAAER
jgi:hypothetical protein